MMSLVSHERGGWRWQGGVLVPFLFCSRSVPAVYTFRLRRPADLLLLWPVR